MSRDCFYPPVPPPPPIISRRKFSIKCINCFQISDRQTDQPRHHPSIHPYRGHAVSTLFSSSSSPLEMSRDASSSFSSSPLGQMDVSILLLPPPAFEIPPPPPPPLASSSSSHHSLWCGGGGGQQQNQPEFNCPPEMDVVREEL